MSDPDSIHDTRNTLSHYKDVVQKYKFPDEEELRGLTVGELIMILQRYHPDEHVAFGIGKPSDPIGTRMALRRIDYSYYAIALHFEKGW